MAPTAPTGMTTPWLWLQLADGAFPAGGFAHSMGLEAALHLGGLADVEAFLDQTLHQVGRASLPFVGAACAEPGRLAELDAACDATLLGHVGNRASRAQGRAFALAASRVFDAPAVQLACDEARRGLSHHAVVFGAVLGALGVPRREAQTAFVHAAVRSVVSAAVRLGALGPLEAQRLQASRAATCEAVLLSCTDLPALEAAQTAPLLELFGALHDRLDGRLFQS
jgi:urease accessory protein